MHTSLWGHWHIFSISMIIQTKQTNKKPCFSPQVVYSVQHLSTPTLSSCNYWPHYLDIHLRDALSKSIVFKRKKKWISSGISYTFTDFFSPLHIPFYTGLLAHCTSIQFKLLNFIAWPEYIEKNRYDFNWHMTIDG